MKKDKQRKNRVMSLKVKAVAFVLIAAVILSAISILISYNVYATTMDNHYKALSTNLAKTAASQLNADDLMRYYNEVKNIGEYDYDKYFNDENYRSSYDTQVDAIKDEKYDKMLATLFDIKDNNDIEYLYVQKIEGDHVTYLFDADHSDDQYQLGTVRPVSKEILGNKDLELGIPSFVSNTEEDGWLVSCMEPVTDENGKPVALVGVDISMNAIMKDRRVYLRNIILLMVAAVALVCILVLSSVNAGVIKLINALSDAARKYVETRDADATDVSALSQLQIHSGDEIETLCQSIQQMERDINVYIINLTAVTAEKERIGAELGLAQKIQSNMLPNVFPAFPERDDFDIFATMNPAKEVGGDFYDFFLVDSAHLGIVIADVSGKGVPAALFMMMSKILIQNAVLSGFSPAMALESVNNRICANNHEEMFVTVWLGILDLKSGVLTAANAGHEKPVVMQAGGEFETLMDKHGFIIGGMPGVKFKEYEVKLEKGSKLFVYTDGVAEATNAVDELFGMDRTVAALNEAKDCSPKEILENVKNRVDEFVGDAPQFDDLTMLCIEYKGMNENEIVIDAKLENVSDAIDFLSQEAEELPLSLRDKHHMEIAMDEIVSNVARYAYKDKSGKASVRIDTDSKGITITVTDSGVPYNPLETPDPDITLSADERGIGGYGIYIVKKVMDEVTYEYKDNKNVFTMRKNYDPE